MESEWKKNLMGFFEEFSIIETSKKETLDDFAQFCEFIVEPAFESLTEALKEFGITSKSKRIKGKSAALQISFPGSRIDNFHYIISLPKNSLELKLKLKIKGRKNNRGMIEEKEYPFMENVKPANILKLKKEDVIQDIIRCYRKFVLEAITDSQ
jgi:hypothetical protein